MGLGGKAVSQKARIRRGSLEVIEIDWPYDWYGPDGFIDFRIEGQEEENAFESWLQKIESGYGYEAYGIRKS